MYLVGKFKRSSTMRRQIIPLSVSILMIFFVFNCKDKTSQSAAYKQITKFLIESPELSTTKQIWIYLPKSYLSSSKDYPVIYMHDAQNLFDETTSYAGEWKIDEYLDSIDFPESIIVGIEHGNEKRIEELTPYKNDKYGGGNGDNYLLFIKNTLKPYVDNNYRTLSNSKNTGIFGSSLGGLISFYGAIVHPETFGFAGVFSPSLWINPEIFSLVEKADVSPATRWFFLTGSEEGDETVRNHEQMVNLLLEKGIPKNNLKSKIIDGGQHNEQLWGNHFGMAYQWLLKNEAN